MLKRIIFISILLFYIISLGFCKRQVKIRNFKCEDVDIKFGKFIQCKVKPIKRDVSEIDVHFKLKKPVESDFMLNMHVNKRGNSIMPSLYNFTIDCCKFMVNRQKHPYHVLTYKMLGFEEYSNINHTCPYKGDVLLKGYRMDEKYIRFIPIPYGEYVLHLRWYQFNKLIALNEVSFVFYDKPELPNRS